MGQNQLIKKFCINSFSPALFSVVHLPPPAKARYLAFHEDILVFLLPKMPISVTLSQSQPL